MKRILMLVALAAITSPLWAQVVMENGISWTAPAERTDGTPLAPEELSGFAVHCGLEPGNYIMQTEAGAQDRFKSRADLIEELSLAWDVEYFCAMTAVDTGGRRSAYSDERNFTVEPAPPAPPEWGVDLN